MAGFLVMMDEKTESLVGRLNRTLSASPCASRGFLMETEDGGLIAEYIFPETSRELCLLIPSHGDIVYFSIIDNGNREAGAFRHWGNIELFAKWVSDKSCPLPGHVEIG